MASFTKSAMGIAKKTIVVSNCTQLRLPRRRLPKNEKVGAKVTVHHAGFSGTDWTFEAGVRMDNQTSSSYKAEVWGTLAAQIIENFLKGYFLAGNTSPQVIKSDQQIDCPINEAFQCVIEQDDEDLKTFYVLIDSPQL